MEISWKITPINNFKSFTSEWDNLNNQTLRLPFLESNFLIPLLEYCTKQKEATLIFGFRHNTPIIAMIVARSGGLHWQTLQPSQLPLGPVLVSEEIKLSKLLPQIIRLLPGFNLMLSLTELDPQYVHRPSSTSSTKTLDYIQIAWLDIKGSFSDYWSMRGKNLRQNLKKQRSKLESEGINVKLECITDADDVELAMENYFKLEENGWKAKTGTAIEKNNTQGRLYQSIMKTFCLKGRGYIYRYLFDERIVAMDLCIESNGILVILKTAYDESINNYSPASLMRQEQIESIFSQGKIRRIEFYGRIMDWHTRWTKEHRTLFHINYYRWPVVGALHLLRQKLNASYKN